MSTATQIPAPPAHEAVSSSKPAPRYTEAQLAKALGLSRNVIKQMRDRYLEPNLDWTRKGKGGSLTFTQRGYEKILRRIDEERSQTADAEVAQAKAEPQTLRVIVRKVVRNPHLLVCARADDPDIPDILVRVRSNALFMQGMQMEVSPSGTMWQYTGRMPKRKGKW